MERAVERGIRSWYVHIEEKERKHKVLRTIRPSDTRASAGPAHAVYFATYEVVKQAMGGNASGHHPIAAGESHNPTLHAPRLHQS